MTDQVPLSRPPKVDHNFRNVAILFSGGPAPAANAVISTAAVSFLRNDIGVVGVRYGYSNLMEYSPENPLVEGEHYFQIDHTHLKRTRNQSGIIIGTARANPGKFVSRDETVRSLKAILEGEYDHLPEDAFYMVGGIEDVIEKAKTLEDED